MIGRIATELIAKFRFARFNQDGSALLTPNGAVRKTPYVLVQSAVPVAKVSGGTIAPSGAISLVNPLPITYADGAWISLPAGAIVGGAAGLYWCIFSTTTAGSVKAVYSDPTLPFSPTIPAGSAATAVGSGMAFTQAANSDLPLFNITIPAGAMGMNGGLRFWAASRYSSGSSNTAKVKFGGTVLRSLTEGTTTLASQLCLTVANRGQSGRQIAVDPFQTLLAVTATPSYSSVDTSVAQQLIFSLNTVVSGDSGVLETFTIEVLPS